jgi:hypothetical protein
MRLAWRTDFCSMPGRPAGRSSFKPRPIWAAADDSVRRPAGRERGGALPRRELRAAEEKREERHTARVAELRQRFIDGPVLVLPSTGGGSFDARGATPIPGSGTVYFSNYRVKGEWGSLDAANGVLVSSDGGTRRVPAPVRINDTTLTGDGWTVTVAPGWVVRSGPRPADHQIVREDH